MLSCGFVRRLLGAPPAQPEGDATSSALTRLQSAVDSLAAAVSSIGAIRPTYSYLGDHRGLVMLQDGSRIFVDTRDLSLAPSLIAYGYWERWIEAAILPLVKPGCIAVDLGANFGYYTLAIARAAGPRGRVHAFEANPRLAALLADSIAINGLGDRVSLQNLAVLDRTGPAELAVDPRWLGGGSIALGGAPGQLERFTVPASTLCEALPGLERIDLLRMDIEGSEPLALKGAEALLVRSSDLTIVSEWAVPMMAARSSVAELVAWLRSLGFAFWRIREDSSLESVADSELLVLPHCDVVIRRSPPQRS